MASALAAPVQAQDAITADEYLNYLHSLKSVVAPKESRSAATVGIPSGFTIPANVGFAAVAFSDKRERGDKNDTDASAALGFGFGDAVSGVGVDLIIGLSSVGKGQGGGFDAADFGDSGSLNVKVSRQFASPIQSGQVASLSLGVGRAVTWGDAEDTDPSYILAMSSGFTYGTKPGALPGMVTIGYGTDIGTFEDMDGLIFGLGVGLTDWLSTGVSWYGDEAIAGLTTKTRLTRNLDMQMGLSYSDVAHQNSDGRWVLSFALIDKKLF
ncbi:hypothetical protein [Sagittula sp. SSi028]|uniref:hypothetical protein n=1 Tax=Sagittula sp. SSi028 TaxID=3400636 RepID=UPI003AF98B3D